MLVDKKKIGLTIVFCIISIYIGFSQLFQMDEFFYILLLLVFCTILIKMMDQTIIPLNNFVVGWLLSLILMFFSITYTYSKNSGIKYSLVFLIFIAIAIFLTGLDGWIPAFQRCLCFGLSVHVLFTIFSIFFTEHALRISSRLLAPEVQGITIRWIKESNHYAGISGQTVVNAFFFTILLGFVLGKVLTKDAKPIWLICGTSLIILIILTGKKGTMLANFVAIIVVIFLYCIWNKKSLRPILIISIISGILFILICSRISIESFQNLMGTSVTSRDRILEKVIYLINQHPLLGSGVDSVAFYVGHSAHNSYIQILCEYGIVGVVFFGFAIIGTFIDLVKKSGSCIRDKKINNFEQSVILSGIYYYIYIIVNSLFESTFFTYQMFFMYLLSSASCFSIITYAESTKKCKRDIGKEHKEV